MTMKRTSCARLVQRRHAVGAGHEVGRGDEHARSRRAKQVEMGAHDRAVGAVRTVVEGRVGRVGEDARRGEANVDPPARQLGRDPAGRGRRGFGGRACRSGRNRARPVPRALRARLRTGYAAVEFQNPSNTVDSRVTTAPVDSRSSR